MTKSITSLQQGKVSGFLHTPEGNPIASFALTHGAGANCGSALLVAVADALQAADFLVLRFDLPFRQARRFGPPAPAHAEADRAGIREALAIARELANVPAYAGGHSYGGRQATMLAAEDPRVADMLLLLSYPLHPPNKPATMRTAHWPKLQTPSFFLHGSKDPFGSENEMNDALSSVPGKHKLVVLEKAGHDLKGGKWDIGKLLVQPFQKFMDSVG
jgi:uncharacterized protein